MEEGTKKREPSKRKIKKVGYGKGQLSALSALREARQTGISRTV